MFWILTEQGIKFSCIKPLTFCFIYDSEQCYLEVKDTFVGQETDAKVQQEGLEMAEIAKGEKVSGGQFMEDFISKRKCLHFHNIILQVCIFTLKKKLYLI